MWQSEADLVAMPDARLARTRQTLNDDYQFGDARPRNYFISSLRSVADPDYKSQVNDAESVSRLSRMYDHEFDALDSRNQIGATVKMTFPSWRVEDRKLIRND